MEQEPVVPVVQGSNAQNNNDDASETAEAAAKPCSNSIGSRHDDKSMSIDYTQNWSKTIPFHADVVKFPTSVEEVIGIVKNPRYTSIKAFGSRHCFNAIADTKDSSKTCSDGTSHTDCSVHLGMEQLTQIWIHDHDDTAPKGPTVTLQAGVTFTQLMPVLTKAGLALTNMPSLPHISVVGGIITGTHGSGIGHHILAKYVVGMELVHADGTLVTYDKYTTPNFDHYLLSLGALGIIVSVTLEVESTYHVAKGIYVDLPWQEFLNHIDDLLFEPPAEFVSVFMDLKAPRMNSVWIGKKYWPHNNDDNNTAPAIAATCYSAPHISGNQFHPVPGQDPVPCVQTGYGPWTDKVNHFLPHHPPSSAGNEIQAEYFVPAAEGKAALEALWKIRNEFKDVVQITELRAIAQDYLPLSQAKDGPMLAIHFTLVKTPSNILNPILTQIQAVLKAYDYKIHWGKWFVCSGTEIEQMYDRDGDLQILRQLIQQHDPKGRFSNDFLQTYIFNNNDDGGNDGKAAAEEG